MRSREIGEWWKNEKKNIIRNGLVNGVIEKNEVCGSKC